MREIILMVIAAGLLAVAVVSGNLQHVIDGDRTGIVWAVGALGFVGTACARWRRAWLTWMCDQGVAPLLGLLGTVIGFMMALGGLSSDAYAANMAGVETALTTTVAGVVVHLWLLLVREFTR